ncbi:wall-associated receptor kinase 2-like [Papaver somniferum]|uniref:wall-associated receptor kinase 2-like n=1 Tax=Papaver somniferum TaxID=3469 RepID=UPI000E704994|nr:wall-associated receptor kinase 2-like [Papaver somniferum]
MAILKVLLKIQCLVLLLIWLQLASAEIPSTASRVAKPGCQDQCGNNVTIPYPFGIGDGCFIEKMFEIKCNNTEPRFGNLPVTDISVLDGQMTIATLIADTCSKYPSWVSLYLGKFTVSTKKNKMISIGCDTRAHINDTPDIGEGCSDCSRNESTTDGSCNGMGCCKTSIPAGLREYNVTVTREYPRKNLIFNNPCSYAFVAEEDSFRFSSSYLQDFKKNGTGTVPVVVDWTIGSEITCEEAAANMTSYACGPNAVCKLRNNITPGYLCSCKPGYAGNPYLDISTGGHCQEIKGCDDNSALGCSPKSPKSESFPRSKFNKIVAGTCLSLSILLVTSFVLG